MGAARQAFIKAGQDGSVTLTLAQLKAVLKDAHKRGYEAGHFDHGQNWGDRELKRYKDVEDGKEIDRNEDDHG